MSATDRYIQLGSNSIYVEQGDVTVNYGEKKIDKILGNPPFFPEVFIGRDDDLIQLHDKLFKGENLLLLINGEGGIGKTTFASRYYHAYQEEYVHLGWVFAQESLCDALLTLADPLRVSFDDGMAGEERLKRLLGAMAQLDKPCLLVIDNANRLKDIESHYVALRTCSNFHLLITSRITDFSQARSYEIKALDKGNAVELFKTYYSAHDQAEDLLLEQILEAVGHNTLIIELLAKNLNNFNTKLRKRYRLTDLLKDLQNKGMLDLTLSGDVPTDYQSTGVSRRIASPEEIISAMYDLGELDDEEKALLSVFAVLPAENIAFETFEVLLLGIQNLDFILEGLNRKGWIEFNKSTASFKCSPVVQEVTRWQTQDRLFVGNTLLVDSLNDLLEYEPGSGHFVNSSYRDAARYARYGESVVRYSTQVWDSLALLMERVGNYHTTTGGIDKALKYNEKYMLLAKELYEEDPGDVELQHNFAISNIKLGETYSTLGHFDRAIECYEYSLQLSKEIYKFCYGDDFYRVLLPTSYSKLGNEYFGLGQLSQAQKNFKSQAELYKEFNEANPFSFLYKTGLAVSYESLGRIYSAQGNLDRALEYYNKENEILQEVYDCDTNHISSRIGLASSCSILGDTYRELRNFNKALEYYNQCQHLSGELYETAPQNVDFRFGLLACYGKLGRTYSALDDYEKALEYCDQCLQLMKELFESFPDTLKYKLDLASCYAMIGEVYRSQRKFKTSLKYHEKALELVEEVHALAPIKRPLLDKLADAYANIGSTLSELGNLDPEKKAEANKYLLLSKDIFSQLANDFPEFLVFKTRLAYVKEMLSKL